MDCTDHYDGQFDIESLEEYVEKRPDAVQGSASEVLRQAILQAVQESILLSPQERSEITEALAPPKA